MSEFGHKRTCCTKACIFPCMALSQWFASLMNKVWLLLLLHWYYRSSCWPKVFSFLIAFRNDTGTLKLIYISFLSALYNQYGVFRYLKNPFQDYYLTKRHQVKQTAHADCFQSLLLCPNETHPLMSHPRGHLSALNASFVSASAFQGALRSAQITFRLA